MIANLVTTVLLAAGGENRLWYVDLELHGACDEVRLECGSEGTTRFLGPFAGGEDRRASIPVPVRSPLGSAGLSAVPLPRAITLPAGSAATVRVIGWSAEQPAAELERLAGPLLRRPRPPSASAPPRAAWPELVLVLLAGACVLRFRRQRWVALVLALAAAGASLELARSRRGGPGAERVLEWEEGLELALEVRVSAEEIGLPRAWLEVVPEGASLELVRTSAGAGTARASGAHLAALEGTTIPPLERGENGDGVLREVWTRSEAGEWTARGSWEPGQPLPPPGGGAGDPPGWLASALPPGRSVLLGRTGEGEWLRCLGFAVD